MLDSLTSLYAPHACLGCQTEGAILCAACEAGLRPATPRCYRCHKLTDGRTCSSCKSVSKLVQVRVVGEYDTLNKDLVGQLKFAGNRSVATILARRMAQLTTDFNSAALIVPIPTATSRVRLRGYDQSVLIARKVAAITKLGYSPALLRRGQHRQLGMNRQARLRQMKESFVAARDIAGKSVILVDDVITTGSTLEAAAAVLKQAGARQVVALVYARA